MVKFVKGIMEAGRVGSWSYNTDLPREPNSTRSTSASYPSKSACQSRDQRGGAGNTSTSPRWSLRPESQESSSSTAFSKCPVPVRSQKKQSGRKSQIYSSRDLEQATRIGLLHLVTHVAQNRHAREQVTHWENNNNNLLIYIARIYILWSIALYNRIFKRKWKYFTVRIN